MFKWSASRINTANYCRRRYFLNYILKDEQLNLSVYRRGSLIHKLIYNKQGKLSFWDKLGEPSEIKRNKDGKVISKKKYSNPEEFVEYAQGQWMRMVNQDEHAGREIIWRFEDEMWEIRNGYLPKVCPPLFSRLREEGPPIESELEFDFILKNRRFNGFIDEVRLRNGEIVIRDYKTESPYGMKEMKLLRDPQLTLYCVGLCASCFKDENFAKRFGLGEEREKLLGHPIFISEKIKPEFFMVGTFPILEEYEKDKMRKPGERRFKGEPPKLIYPTERSDKDFFGVLLFLEDIEYIQKQYLAGKLERIPAVEGGKKCDDCGMRIACSKRLEEELKVESNKEGCFKDKFGQHFFSFVSPYAYRQPKPKSRQKRFKWKKKSL